MTMTMTMTMTNIYLTINQQLAVVNSYFYKLLIGLETIIKTKIFVTIVIATKKGFNSITYYYFLWPTCW